MLLHEVLLHCLVIGIIAELDVKKEYIFHYLIQWSCIITYTKATQVSMITAKSLSYSVIVYWPYKHYHTE